MDWALLIVTATVFGGCWWGLSKLGANVFLVAALSLLLALLVYSSRTLLGIPL